MVLSKFPKVQEAAETSSLLSKPSNVGAAQHDYESTAGSSSGSGTVQSTRKRRALSGERFDDVPDSKRQLGLLSAVMLIFNRIIGTGIYATPSNILRSSGSVGVALLMWLVGAMIAACGSAVYTELGTGLPRSGGEKNYFEYIYRRPKFIATCIFSVYAIAGHTSTANSVVFSEYLLNALSIESTYFNTRLTAWLCITFLIVMHGTWMAPWGVRLQNTLGAGKLVVLSAIALSGLLCLAGVPGFEVKGGHEVPNNFSSWENFWAGSKGKGANAFVTGLYNVIWSFIGYSNANYAMSEIRDPVRTIKRAVPLAVCACTAVYVLINVAYFAAVSKNDILGSRRIVAALFFRNLFGPAMEKILSAFIALSTLGNLLAGHFTQGRVIQEIGREGVIPFASYLASNKPFGTPFAGLLVQYTLSCIFLFFIPPGDAYIFMVNFGSYCNTIINLLVGLGLFLLYTKPFKGLDWDPPFKAPKSIIALYLLSNIFLVATPLIPPVPGSFPYKYLPYWSHAAGATALSLVGVGYWYGWSRWLPLKRGYTLHREVVKMNDGVTRARFRKVWTDGSSLPARQRAFGGEVVSQ